MKFNNPVTNTNLIKTHGIFEIQFDSMQNGDK